ncbi:MAG TPA: hypothetical protein VHW09_27090 [Bryobacteraceae bacterium]|jgi:hypothetical protein|nr:hypothetical protein [Bryobacteraceae bacterium]
MNDEPKKYGVMAEWKEEGPLVMEGPLLTLDAARARMGDLAGRSNVIRVAMFKVIYEGGNNTLIPQEPLL